MDYEAARPLIRSGDLIAFHGRGIFAWIIRTVTRSEYNHIALAWVAGGRVLLLESRVSHGGVTIQRALSQALKDGATWIPSGITWTPEHEDRAFAPLGEPYGWVDAIRAGLGLRSTSRGYQCAEYVAQVIGDAEPCHTPGGIAGRYPGGVRLE